MHFASRLGLSDTPAPVSSKAAAAENKNTAPDLNAAKLKALEERVASLEERDEKTYLIVMSLIEDVEKLLEERNAVTRNGPTVTPDRNVTRNASNADRQRRYRERKKTSG